MKSDGWKDALRLSHFLIESYVVEMTTIGAAITRRGRFISGRTGSWKPTCEARKFSFRSRGPRVPEIKLPSLNGTPLLRASITPGNISVCFRYVSMKYVLVTGIVVFF